MNSNRTSGQTAGAAFTATYDSQDRMLTYNSKVYSYNANGDLVQVNWGSVGSDYFISDVFGNIVQANLINGHTYDYLYDHLGRRARKAQDGDQHFRFLYDDQSRVVLSVSSGDIYKEYVQGISGTTPEYMNSYINDIGRYRFIKDHLGSPRLVVNTTTGAVIHRLDYNDLGDVTADTNPGFQPYGFAGGIYDVHMKVVKFGAREYDPRSGGRWMTRDPILFSGGDTNLYGYVLNDPINHIDPMGLATDLICRALGGSGGAAGGMHCFLRITPEAGSSLGTAPITLSLLTPDMKVGNKYVNAGVDSGSGTFSTSVDNGQCNTSGAQDKIDQAIMASFNSQPNGTPYSPIPYGEASNSNAFIHRVLQGAGLTVIPNAPLGAVGY